ncbi:MAG: sulfatase [Planctomycetales bacterium]|nr:sulfatase [Planctomycetales bacterium]
MQPGIIALLWLGLSANNASADRQNILLICVDDLRPELNCYGMDYIHSPNIDALATRGRLFTRHFVQAPTCGASRSALLTGRYGPADNDALFKRAAQIRSGKEVYPSMPEWFRQHGYTTVSVGKVSHHPGGRGGADWNDDNLPEMPQAWDRHLLPAGPWQHPRGWMHGLANGQIRSDSGEMDVFQSMEGDDIIYPDGVTSDAALRQLDLLAANSDKPFFLAYGILRPHLPFGAPAKYMAHYRDAALPPIAHAKKPIGRTTWHASGEFMKYNRWSRDPNEDAQFAIEVRKHYAACVSYADAQVGKMLERLDQLGIADETNVILWGDHGWHLGEHAIWGKHSLFEESLLSPLIIAAPALGRSTQNCDEIVETIDLFPTLCDLVDLPTPGFVQGTSLASLLSPASGSASENNPRTAVSYFRNARTIRTETHRLVVHADGFSELYDHRSDPGETQNIAAHSADVVDQLRAQLNARHSPESP